MLRLSLDRRQAGHCPANSGLSVAVHPVCSPPGGVSAALAELAPRATYHKPGFLAGLPSRVLMIPLEHLFVSCAYIEPPSCTCWPPHTVSGGASADLLHRPVPHVALAQQSAMKALQVLVVHLKRFLHTRTRREKIETPVDFPLEGLDLTPYLLHHQVAICLPPHTAWLTPRLSCHVDGCRLKCPVFCTVASKAPYAGRSFAMQSHLVQSYGSSQPARLRANPIVIIQLCAACFPAGCASCI